MTHPDPRLVGVYLPPPISLSEIVDLLDRYAAEPVERKRAIAESLREQYCAPGGCSRLDGVLDSWLVQPSRVATLSPVVWQ